MEDATRTVVLADERSGLQATWVPDAGMVCSSLKHRGEELLAQNEGLEAYAERGKTMGIPLLYPWANRLAGWSYEVADRSVTIEHDRRLIATDGNGLPIHGVIGGRQAWNVKAVHDSLTATLAWSAERKDLFGAFPFEHELRHEAELAGGTLTVTVTVEACGEDKVPVAFGFHPYLSLPGAERGRYEVELPRMKRLRLDRHQIPDGRGEWAEPWRGALAERVWDDGWISLAEPAVFAVQAAGRRIEMTFVEGYPCAQTYAPRTGRFVCFEPMTAPANALRSGDRLTVLAPGERYVATWELRVLDVERGDGFIRARRG